MDKTPNLVTIRGGLTLIDAQVLKLRLERAGIFCHLANQYAAQIGAGRLGGTTALVWLQVPDFEEARARELLEERTDELSEIDAGLLESEAEDLERCPACRSNRIDYATGSDDVIQGSCRECDAVWTL